MSLHIDAQTDEGIMPQQTSKPAVPPTTAAATDAAQAAALRAEKEGKTVADLLKSKNEPEV